MHLQLELDMFFEKIVVNRSNLLGCPVGTACIRRSYFSLPIKVVFPAPSKPRKINLAFLFSLINGTVN